jgi:hypothetical protein
MKLCFFGVCITICLGLLQVGKLYAQTDSCLQLVCIDGQFDSVKLRTCNNPDSVKIDICSSSPTYNLMYGKRWFYVWFTHYVINLPQAPADTLLEVSWSAIDTVYPALRSAFADLETKYGTLYLKKYAPNWVDSTHNVSHIYHLRFDQYVCIDSVLNDIGLIQGLTKYHFFPYPVYMLNVLDEQKTPPILFLYPNPATSILNISRYDGEPIHRIVVLDLTGKTILEKQFEGQTEVVLDIHFLPNAAYRIICDGLLKQSLVIMK